MAPLQIIVANKSGNTHSYSLFIEKPLPSTSRDLVYQNVYLTSPEVHTGNGTAVFQINNTYYAVCGTSGLPLGAKVTVTTGDFQPARLTSGHENGSTHQMTGANHAADLQDDKLVYDCTTEGSYEIHCLSDFKTGDTGKSSLTKFL